MRTHWTVGFLTAALLGVPPLATGAAIIVTPKEMARHVELRDVSVGKDGSVSGVLVNRSSGSVRDVGLLITHQFLWKNEFRPGTDNPSSADRVVVRGEMPPGGQLAFRVRPDSSLPARRDGRFKTLVNVTELTQLEGGGSPTAGVGAAPTRLQSGEGEAAPGERMAPAPRPAPKQPVAPEKETEPGD